MFELSTKSLRKLDEVHPELARLTRKAIQITKVDFGVHEGIRSYETQVRYMREKKTTTLHSLHLEQHDGYSHAIDIFAYIDGKANYRNQNYRPIIQAFITASIALEIQVEFGHLWKGFQDSVHIQLNQKYY